MGFGKSTFTSPGEKIGAASRGTIPRRRVVRKDEGRRMKDKFILQEMTPY